MQMTCSVRCDRITKVFRLSADETQEHNGLIGADRVSDGRLVALDDVSFSLSEGDRLGIIGSNGAGKSTLLRILAGIIRPTSGTAEVVGRVTSVQEQSSMLFPGLTGRSNVVMMHRLMGLTDADAAANMGEIVRFSDLGRMMDEPVKTYSSGMVLRLTFALILVLRPEVLILDEALGAGDAEFRQRSTELLNDLTSRSRIVLFTSHQMQEVVQHCNRCMVLDKGRMTYLGGVHEAVTAYYGQAYDTGLTNDPRVASLSARMAGGRAVLTPDNEFAVEVVFRLSERFASLSPVLNVFGMHGPVLTDSPIYHPSPGQSLGFEGGEHVMRVCIPAHTFNVGEYRVSVSLGDGERIFAQADSVCSFTVLPGEWERDSPWVLMGLKAPLRPRLRWERDAQGQA